MAVACELLRLHPSCSHFVGFGTSFLQLCYVVAFMAAAYLPAANRALDIEAMYFSVNRETHIPVHDEFTIWNCIFPAQSLISRYGKLSIYGNLGI
jgi:hypothetical protein